MSRRMLPVMQTYIAYNNLNHKTRAAMNYFVTGFALSSFQNMERVTSRYSSYIETSTEIADQIEDNAKSTERLSRFRDPDTRKKMAKAFKKVAKYAGRFSDIVTTSSNLGTSIRDGINSARDNSSFKSAQEIFTEELTNSLNEIKSSLLKSKDMMHQINSAKTSSKIFTFAEALAESSYLARNLLTTIPTTAQQSAVRLIGQSSGHLLSRAHKSSENIIKNSERRRQHLDRIVLYATTLTTKICSDLIASRKKELNNKLFASKIKERARSSLNPVNTTRSTKFLSRNRAIDDGFERS